MIQFYKKVSFLFISLFCKAWSQRGPWRGSCSAGRWKCSTSPWLSAWRAVEPRCRPRGCRGGRRGSGRWWFHRGCRSGPSRPGGGRRTHRWTTATSALNGWHHFYLYATLMKYLHLPQNDSKFFSSEVYFVTAEWFEFVSMCRHSFSFPFSAVWHIAAGLCSLPSHSWRLHTQTIRVWSQAVPAEERRPGPQPLEPQQQWRLWWRSAGCCWTWSLGPGEKMEVGQLRTRCRVAESIGQCSLAPVTLWKAGRWFSSCFSLQCQMKILIIIKKMCLFCDNDKTLTGSWGAQRAPCRHWSWRSAVLPAGKPWGWRRRQRGGWGWAPSDWTEPLEHSQIPPTEQNTARTFSNVLSPLPSSHYKKTGQKTTSCVYSPSVQSVEKKTSQGAETDVWHTDVFEQSAMNIGLLASSHCSNYASSLSRTELDGPPSAHSQQRI